MEEIIQTLNKFKNENLKCLKSLDIKNSKNSIVSTGREYNEILETCQIIDRSIGLVGIIKKLKIDINLIISKKINKKCEKQLSEIVNLLSFDEDYKINKILELND